MTDRTDLQYDSLTRWEIWAVIILACAWAIAFTVDSRASPTKLEPGIWVIDGFYRHPRALRWMCLRFVDYRPHTALYETFGGIPFQSFVHELHRPLTRLLGVDIDLEQWIRCCEKRSNGWIQLLPRDSEPIVHHDRLTRRGGVVYLSPNPPPESGTAFYTHAASGHTRFPSPDEIDALSDDERDVLSEYERRDFWRKGQPPQFHRWVRRLRVENVFNRLLLFDGSLFHCAEAGFGQTVEDARMYQTFFF